MKALIGTKIGMTRIFNDEGRQIPVTLVYSDENVVSQVKEIDKDGYLATQVALNDNTSMNQPLAGHLKKTGIKSRSLREFKLEKLAVGDKLDVDQFEKGEKIFVQSISKGKGFAGTVKRHNFHTGPKTHGSDNYRQPGSIGSAYPQRVIKGRRMAGHMGYEKVTVKNLEVVSINADKRTILIKGAIPGPNQSTVFIWSLK